MEVQTLQSKRASSKAISWALFYSIAYWILHLIYGDSIFSSSQFYLAFDWNFLLYFHEKFFTGALPLFSRWLRCEYDDYAIRFVRQAYGIGSCISTTSYWHFACAHSSIKYGIINFSSSSTKESICYYIEVVSEKDRIKIAIIRF